MTIKLTTLLLIVTFLQVSAKGFGQISLNEKNSSLKAVFRNIEHQSSYVFFSKDYDLKNLNVNVYVRNASIEEVLKQCFKNLPFTYKIIDKAIVVRKIETEQEVKRSIETSFAITVKGKVTNSTGQPLPGVNVKIKDSSIGTVTDKDGVYTIVVPDERNVLIFSYVGFVIQEIAINSRQIVNVQLVEETGSLNEIIVTGYGTQRKKDITGSIAVVDIAALKAIPSGSAAQALQGQASGVNVISPGMPGGRSNIFIRGVTSFGNTQPLVIVDGIQATLEDINAQDIESMQVLKDAGAASIYGVRGSNGVIVISTKKGKSGTPMLSYEAYYGMQLPLSGNPFNILNSEDYARLSKIATPASTLFENGLPDYIYKGPSGSGTGMEGDPTVDPAKYTLDLQNPSNNYIIQKVNKTGTNWFQEIFDPAPMSNHTLTASGATDRATYLFSLGYFNQKGTLTNTYLKRYSARINTELKVNKNIRIGENVYLFYRQNPGFNNQAQSNAISNSYRMMPIIPVYDIQGNFGGTFGGPGLGNGSNPVAIQSRTTNDRNNAWNVVGNVYAEVDFLNKFTARTSFGGTIDNRYIMDFAFNNYNNSEGNTNLNALNENALYNSNSMWTNTVNYSNLLGKHNVKVTAGTEAIKNSGRSLSGGSQNLFSTEFDYLSLGNGTTNVTNSSVSYINTLFSLFGRIDYSFDDKYLLGVTVRRDGSSKFGSTTRFGTFPSVSLGWRVTNERFMKDVEWLDDLKVRGSYGVLGSEINVSPSNAFSLYGGNFTNAYYDIAGTNNSIRQGFYQVRLGNPETSWEENIISNVGFDAVVFKDATISLEYYRKSINGLLFPQPLPFTAGGAEAPIVNIGDIKNTGFDISLSYRFKASRDFELKVGTNITTYKNEIIDIPNPGYFDVASGLSFGNFVRNQKGQSVSAFFGYDVVGLFKDNEDVASSPTQNSAAPGRFKYRDINNDNVISAADRTFIGNPNPDFTYGINLGFTYKDFDFSTLFYGSQGNQIVNSIRNLTDFFGTFVGGKSNVLLDAWTPENTDTKIPKIEGTNSFSTSGTPSSYYIEDGSYLKLRSLVVGYTLRPVVLKKVGLSKLRVYLQGANLFTITQYSGLDPELSGSSSSFGVDYGNYPNNQRSFLVGVNVSF